MTYGLTPRPELGPDELAALVAVADELLKKSAVEVIDNVPNWRFSGRWFNAGPLANRRPGHVS